MTALTPHQYAATFHASLATADLIRPRSEQVELGVSSIGVCREQARRVLVGEVGTKTVGMAALMGTWAHDGITEARRLTNPDLLLNEEVEVTLPSGIVVVGHLDECDPSEPSVTDYKTDDGITMARKTGSDDQQRFQRMLYALGAVQAGLVAEQGLVVRNIWVDRSGRHDEYHIEQEPFSREVIAAADVWLSDAVYAAQHGEPAQRDKDRAWCKVCCPFFESCRGGEDDALDLMDPRYRIAAEAYLDGKALEKAGAAQAEDTRRVLADLQEQRGTFMAGEYAIRWTQVNRKDGVSYPKLMVEHRPSAARDAA